MNTLVKIIVTSILSLSVFSCNSNLAPGVSGNGKVVTQTRDIGSNFQLIEVSTGLNVYLTQDETESIKVQADENLHKLIITKIEDNTLKIYADKKIGSAEAKKIMVNFKNVTKISSASGSDIYSVHAITAENLELSTSSGGIIELEVNCIALHCRASTGSDMIITGSTQNLTADASTGANINAKNLISLTADANATTGANISVNASNKFTSTTSTGADITNHGAAEKETASDD